MSGPKYMRMIVAILAVVLAASPAPSEPQLLGTVRVLDGDTVAISIRLLGFNTPEQGKRAKCEKESELAKRASARLRELLGKGKPSIELDKCSCRPGHYGTNKCNFGRACGRLTVDGKDVGAILISEGLAREYVCDAETCPKPSDWCS